MTIAGTTIRVEMTSSSKWVIYNGEALGIQGGTVLFAANDDEWNYLGLTFRGNRMQVYHDGEFVSTVTTGLSDDSRVTGIKGSGDHATAANGLFAYNLAVYDGVLGGSGFACQNTHGMPLSIPGPAAATLGLMGLPGFLMRRKRA